MMANIIITNIDWLMYPGGKPTWPIKKIPMELPWNKIEDIQGFCGENILIDISYVLKDLEKFKNTLLAIKAGTDRLDGEILS